MTKRLLLVLTIVAALVGNAAAATVIIVKTKKNADINAIAAAMGGTVIDSSPNDQTYLVSVPSMPTSLPANVDSITENKALVLPRFKGAVFSSQASSGTLPWYAKQPAMKLIQAEQALAQSTGRGIIIADVDSSIDTTHPALRGHLIPGYDFLQKGGPKRLSDGVTLMDQSTASFLDQSTASFLDDQSTASFLDQSTASFLDDQSTASFLDDQSTASFLDQSTASFLDSHNAGHGHATMVAGIMVAIAPDALIMPLRAFDDSGTGDSFVVAKAIRYAVSNGAHIINLSLGFSAADNHVRAAIDYATSQGVIVVAASGNAGSGEPQYPAAYPNVIGVGATDLNDIKATFSNYGSDVFVTAPGVDIITAYPGGWAVVSGTSFSSAFVAAEAALIRVQRSTGIRDVIGGSAVNINSLNPSYAGQLGYGRINLLAAVTFFGSTAQTPASLDLSGYIITFKPGTAKGKIKNYGTDAGAKVKHNFDIVDAVAITTDSSSDDKVKNKVKNDPDVLEMIQDRAVFAQGGGAGTGGTSQTTPSGVTRLGVSTSTSNGTGVGVAILDTGIDLVNTDLAPAIQTYSAFGGSCQDDNGHGTHVAGLVAALNNTVGVVGIAPGAKPYCVKVLDSTGSGTDSNIIAGLNWVYSNWNLVSPNIRVVNMSLGRAGSISDNTAYRTAIQQLYNLGIVVVTAAGNDQTVDVTKRVPQAYPEVINVASTTALAGTTACKTQAVIPADAASYFTTDGKFDPVTKIGVTISAPGEDQENITSACQAVTVGMLSTKLGGGTIRYSGSSISSPLVAGVVARMMQKGVSGVENIRTQLRTTAQKIGTAPVDSRITGYTFDGEREGIAKAP
jgi:subtilisin family serine protease